MAADMLRLFPAQQAFDDVWQWLIIAVISAGVALILGLYNMQRGPLPSQVEMIREMEKRIARLEKLNSALTNESHENLLKIQAQGEELRRLTGDNARLEELTRQQAAVIEHLQGQLTDLIAGRRRSGARSQLRDALTSRLNDEELRAWVQDLSPPILYENLGGDTLAARIRSLLDMLERHGRAEEALQVLRRQRPDIRTEV